MLTFKEINKLKDDYNLNNDIFCGNCGEKLYLIMACGSQYYLYFRCHECRYESINKSYIDNWWHENNAESLFYDEITKLIELEKITKHESREPKQIDLQPCPFCGGTARIMRDYCNMTKKIWVTKKCEYSHEHTPININTIIDIPDKQNAGFVVVCDDCGAQGGTDITEVLECVENQEYYLNNRDKLRQIAADLWNNRRGVMEFD